MNDRPGMQEAARAAMGCLGVLAVIAVILAIAWWAMTTDTKVRTRIAYDEWKKLQQADTTAVVK